MRGGDLDSGDVSVCTCALSIALGVSPCTYCLGFVVANYLLKSVQALQSMGHTPYAVTIQVRNALMIDFPLCCIDDIVH